MLCGVAVRCNFPSMWRLERTMKSITITSLTCRIQIGCIESLILMDKENATIIDAYTHCFEASPHHCPQLLCNGKI